MLYNLYSALLGQPCSCVRHIRYQAEEKGTIDDTRIYMFENEQYLLYQVVKAGQNSVSALRIKARPWEPLLRMPDFGKVGIFETDGTMGEVKQLEKSQIKGKLIIVGKYAVTVPKIILEEAC